MAKAKKRYKGFWCSQGFWSGAPDGEPLRKSLGETWAVSEEQAINNFCFRNSIKKENHHDWACDGCRKTWVEVEEIGNH